MAITSIGYDGTIDEADWTQLMGEAAQSTYGVSGGNDWKVTAHATLTRGVSIATGSGWGWGVYDTSSTTVSVAGASISSGSRWDLVVARRNWSGLGGSTSFVIITGTSTQALPSRNTTPGDIDDQPIALVQFTAGQSAPTAILDLRVWSGTGGGLVGNELLARDYNDAIGTRICIDGEDWLSDVSGTSQFWVRISTLKAIQLYDTGLALSWNGSPANTPFYVQAGSYRSTTDSSGYCRLIWPTPFPNGLLTVTAVNGDDDVLNCGGTTFAGSGNPIHGTSALGNKTDWVYVVHGFASGNNDGPVIRKKNTVHRINWIAIGW
jgi:hypothetical protein